MNRLSLLLIVFFGTGICAKAQTHSLTGRITDADNNPIPFASVYIKNTTYGTSANKEGNYKFDLQPGNYHVVYRFVGYRSQEEDIHITGDDVRHDVTMATDSFVVKSNKVRHGRKDDEGNDIMRQVIKKREFYLKQVEEYSCAVYIKSVQKLISAPRKLMNRDVVASLDLDSGRKGIMYQSEMLSTYNFKQPDKVKEIVIASKSVGQNTSFSYNKASDLSVNFYKNYFTIEGLSPRRIVSPAASEAMLFYRYKLLGSTTADGKTIDKIEVIPRRPHDAVYRGVIYIVEGDWSIYSADLYLTKQASINLVDTLEISQQYVPVKDDIWMPASVQYNFKGNVLGFKFEGYYAGIYNNYNLSPNFKDDFFDGEIMRVDTQANKRDEHFWNTNRPLPLTAEESRDYQHKDSVNTYRQSLPYLDSVEHVNNQLTPFNFTVTGYQYTNRRKSETFYMYPLYQTIFYNTVEGYGINLRAKYVKTFKDGSSYSVTPALRYGFSNKLFNANVHLAYNYDPLHQAAWFASFGSDVLDLSNVGTRSLVFNTLSSLLYESNFVKFYRSQFAQVGYQRELWNGVLWNADLEYATRTQLYNTSFNHIFTSNSRDYTSNNPLTPEAETPLFPKHQALTFKTSVLFTFDQRYITRPTGRVYEHPGYPQLRINYRKGINGLGSDVDYDFASADLFDDHLSIGLYGYSAYKITVGDFFNRSKLYYMDYNHFLGNQGTVFDPTIGGFHYLPFYNYSANKAFLEAHYEHNFVGNIFNMVPFLRKLKLEEIVGGNYLTEQGKANYYEFYFGVKRLFFRFDYGVAFDANHRVTQGIKIFYGLK